MGWKTSWTSLRNTNKTKAIKNNDEPCAVDRNRLAKISQYVSDTVRVIIESKSDNETCLTELQRWKVGSNGSNYAFMGPLFYDVMMKFEILTPL